MSKQSNNTLAAHIWALRAQAEMGAERRFKEVLCRMVDSNVDKSILKLAYAAIGDENRHTSLCSEVARALGHPTGFQMPSQHQNSQNSSHIPGKWPGTEKQWQVTACEIVMLSCITETINTSLLASILEHIDPSKRTGRIVKNIFDDEARHAQIGWRYLEWISNKESLSFLAEKLPRMFDICVSDELFIPIKIEDDKVEDVAEFHGEIFGFGVLPENLRLQQFRETIENLVIPGFRHFNVDTCLAEQWLADKMKCHYL